MVAKQFTLLLSGRNILEIHMLHGIKWCGLLALGQLLCHFADNILTR
jgi:hypothetical protein